MSLIKHLQFFQRVFADDYLVKQEVKRVRSIATSRIIDFHKGHIRETKNVLGNNPIYLIDWPSDKNLILRYLKIIEDEKRKK